MTITTIVGIIKHRMKKEKIMPAIYTSKELIKMIEKDGWYLVGVEGSHHKYRHKTKKGPCCVEAVKKEIML